MKHQARRGRFRQQHHVQVAPPPDPTITVALVHHQAGRLAEAEALYKKVLQLRPTHPEALHLLGLINFQKGNADDAVHLIRKAIALNQRAPAYYANLALALRAQHKLGEAEASLRRALDLNPGYPEAYNNLGVVLVDLGRRPEAIPNFRRAIVLKRDYADAYSSLGLALREEGQHGEALTILRSAIEIKPDSPEAHHNLGVVLTELGRHGEAIEHFQRAIVLKPEYAEAHNNLGCTMRELGRNDEALACFQRAVEIDPEYVEANNNLGVAMGEHGSQDEAIERLRQAVALKPDYAQAQCNLGVALSERGLVEEAIAALQRAIELEPETADAHNNLGVVFKKQRKPEEAAASFRRAVELRPTYVEALSNLGVVLGELGRREEAIATLRQTIELRPDYAEAHNNLAGALRASNQIDEALASVQRALALKADYPDALQNLAIVLSDQDRQEESITTLRRLLELKPENAEAHFALALALLLHGEFEEGWAEYEWRWRSSEFGGPRNFTQPLWDGSPLEGRTILVYAEQGVGDTVQFARYVQLVASRGGRVVLECQRELTALFQQLDGVHRLVERGQPLPEFDVHVPLLSLPYLLDTQLDTIPAQIPYLRADPERVEAWADKLPASPDVRVGIVWAGNPAFKNDQRRSMPIDLLTPLASVPGVQLISLQKGAGAAQAANPPSGMALENVGPMLADFGDTAAVIDQLDLIISVDTAVAHLAGALGRPVWILLPFAPDWRWLRHREDTPWYPTASLFRQRRLGDWHGLIERVAGTLTEFAAADRPLRNVLAQRVLKISAELVSVSPAQHRNGTVHAVTFPDVTGGVHAAANGVDQGAPVPTSTPRVPLCLAVPLQKAQGWRIRGRYLARELSRLHNVRLVTDEFERETIGDELEYRFLKQIASDATTPPADSRVLQAIPSPDLHPQQPLLKGQFNVGYTVLSDNVLAPAAVEHAPQHFDVIVAGSTWCKDVLESHGVHDVRVVLQGIDPVLFHPAGAEKRCFQDRFVVFSGGRFALRKGQDIVIRAFKVLQERHDDVLLVNAWSNPDEASFNTMRPSSLIRFSEWESDQQVAINRILADNGLDLDRVITLGPSPHAMMAKLYGDTDVGVFPSRSEGGTNLLLMEYMACAKPAIASYSSGHRDVVNAHNAVLIRNMKSMTLAADGVNLAVWDDPDLDETIAHLEWAYQNRDRLRALGLRAGQDLATLTWQRTAEQLSNILSTAQQRPVHAAHDVVHVESSPLRHEVAGKDMAELQLRIASQYRVGDDLPKADPALLDSIRQSREYQAIQERVSGTDPTDSWEQDGLHLFVFEVRPLDGSAAPEPAVAVFTMHPDVPKPLSAVLVTPRSDAAEAEVLDLSNPASSYVAPTTAGVVDG